jgi:chromosome segregation ATPase
MKLLKLRLDELTNHLETNNGKMMKLQDQMGKNQDVQKKLNKKLEDSKSKKITLLNRIKNNDQSIIEINISVNINNIEIVTLSTQIGTIESQISNKRAEIQKNTNYATSQTKEHYVSLITKTELQISTVTTSLTEINTKISVSETSASTKKNTKTEKINCVNTNETRRAEFKVSSAAQGGDVEAVFNKIKAIHDLGLAPLRETIDMVDENTAVLTWIVKAKTNMHTYLDNLPENPDVQKEGLEEFNRRRRRRMRRRRMI